MSFTRTNSGMSNLALFYSSEVIIYTEGGNKSFSTEEVEQGQYSNKSTDIKFWSAIFENSTFNKKVHFRALGSKTASKSICEKIIAGQINNTIVARDRDLDGLCPNSELYDSPFILYTKGYSWENDVYVEQFTTEQIKSMILEQDLPEEISELIRDSYNKYVSIGSRLLKLDLIFRDQNKKFLTEVNGERFFNPKNSAYIDKKQIASFIKQKKADLTRPVSSEVNLSNICPIMNNYGKLLCSLSLNIINFICKKYSDYKSIPKQIIEANMIDRFRLKHQSEAVPYYSELIGKLVSA
ncbi:hypothetical protein [Alteromonas lipotrueae]|uniref:hypothetical protein n=1 Tax=Alteromonas lipotrueae TaxID=2803814 RepID=UPI001C45EF14|nr:hypothetical protein [Alteromonas lipotrueae]